MYFEKCRSSKLLNSDILGNSQEKFQSKVMKTARRLSSSKIRPKTAFEKSNYRRDWTDFLERRNIFCLVLISLEMNKITRIFHRTRYKTGMKHFKKSPRFGIEFSADSLPINHSKGRLFEALAECQIL